MSAALTPRFAVSCDEELLAGAGRLAQQTGAIVQSHLAETLNECHYVKQLFGGRSYVDVYRRAGLLGGRSVLGHGIHLDEEDRSVLRDSKTVIAHCPTANTFLRSGTMDRAAMVRAGIPVALGSDIGAGYERSMVRVARAMIEAAASIGDAFPSADAAWYMITAGNADALGWRDAGRLRVDTPADLLVIQPAVPWTDSQVNPLAMLMFAWDDRWISKTFVRGEWKRAYSSSGE